MEKRDTKIDTIQKQLEELMEKIIKCREPCTRYRFIVFITIILTAVGPFFMYDLPQIYEDVIIRTFDKTAVEVESLYSIYSLPNLIMTPLGSILLTYTGLGQGGVIFHFLIVLGSLMIYFGFAVKNFMWVFWGRAVYGLGSEVGFIIAATVCDRWFSGKFMSIAQSMLRTIGFLGVFLGLFIGPDLFIKYRVMCYTLSVYVFLSFFSFLMMVIYSLTEHRHEIASAKREKILQREKQIMIKQVEESEGKDFASMMLTSVNATFKDSTLSKHEVKEQANSEDDNDQNKDEKMADFQIQDVKSFSILFWITSFVFAIGSNCYLQFLGFCTDCLINRFGYTFQQAKNTISLLPIFGMIFGPIISTVITKVGFKPLFLIFALVLEIFLFLFLRSLPSEPSNYVLLSIIGMGMFYSTFVAVVWPAMTMTVPQSSTAAALGLATLVQNIFMSSFPYYFGKINKPRTKTVYDESLVSLAGIGIFSLILTIWMFIQDLRTGKILSLPENDKRVGEMRKKMQKEYNNMVRVRAEKKKINPSLNNKVTTK